jgi:hypothetical protein
MADAKISALTAFTTPTATNLFVGVNGGATKKVTYTNLEKSIVDSQDYAELFSNSYGTATTINTADVWYQYTGFTNSGAASGATPDPTNDHITINKAGKYLITSSVSFSGGANSTYEIEVKKNNGVTDLTNIHTERKLSAGGDVGSVSLSGIGDLSATDTIELWVRNIDNTNNVTLKDVTLSLCYIGS